MSWIEDRNERAFENAEREWEEPPDDDDIIVTFCDWCDNEIYVGDYLTEINGDCICDECFRKWINKHRYEVKFVEDDNDEFKNEYEEYSKQHDEGDEQ